MVTSKKFVVGICSIVLAVLLFFVSGVDRIELPGKYKVVEVAGLELSDLWESFGLEEDVAEEYISFGLFGDIDFDFVINSEYEDELDEYDREYIDDLKGRLSEPMEDSKWSLDGDEIVLEIDDDDDGVEYSLKSGELEIGEDGEIMVLKREGISAIVCPSTILKLISLLFLVIGIFVMLTGKNGKKSTPVGGYTVTSATKLCPYCNSAVAPEDKFCLNCGSAIGETETVAYSETAPYSEPAPGKFCANCGTAVGEDDAFCGVCGTPTNNEIKPEETSTLKTTFVSADEVKTEEPGELRSTFFNTPGDL